ncbi:MAG: co-chaperone GroES [Parcubacteria group bacterium]|nr:co-chaperone GroES [Parcubacteria group bacterium]
MSETEKNTKSIIQPLGDRVLVEVQNDSSQVTDAGIIIPDTVDREKPQQGKVIAVGEGRMTDSGETIPLQVKRGDTIIFSKYGPDEITVDDKEYYIIGEGSILAVIK